MQPNSTHYLLCSDAEALCIWGLVDKALQVHITGWYHSYTVQSVALHCLCEAAKIPLCQQEPGVKKGDVALCLVYVKCILFSTLVSPYIQPSFLPLLTCRHESRYAKNLRVVPVYDFLQSLCAHRTSVLCCALSVSCSRSTKRPVNTMHPPWQHHTWQAAFPLCGLLLCAFIGALAFHNQNKHGMLFWHHQVELIDRRMEKEAEMSGKSSHWHRWLQKTCNQFMIFMFRIKMSSKLLTAA